MKWRVAKSLEKLLAQIDAHAPKRSKESDGGIGDAAHASRASDHNPWVKDRSGVGVVTARDFTHDPADGCDAARLAQALTSSNDRRLKYVIWNRRIWNAGRGWMSYKGVNPHTHHVHVSVLPDSSLYDSEIKWSIGLAAPDPSAPKAFKLLRVGSKGADVDYVQGRLKVPVTGTFDQATYAAVREFQSAQRILVDGIVGPHTWELLHDPVSSNDAA